MEEKKAEWGPVRQEMANGPGAPPRGRERQAEGMASVTGQSGAEIWRARGPGSGDLGSVPPRNDSGPQSVVWLQESWQASRVVSWH